ncbi:MAG TPA: SCO family protein [Steroidobacteraceae bacterium]|nr:SCO family protein [Steroidobacteraceae bacterium]
MRRTPQRQAGHAWAAVWRSVALCCGLCFAAALDTAALAHPMGSMETLPDRPSAGPDRGPHTTLRPEDTSELGFKQRMGAALPLGVALRDEAGRPVRLGDFFHGEPVVLVLDYLRCRTLCGVVLEHTASTLALTPLIAGRDYRVVAISIDPRDGPAESRAAREKYLAGLPPARAAAWHFLTGPESSVRAVADAVGFHYRYDPAVDQFAHPAGIMLATPRGTIARYLLGVGFRPLDLRLGLTETARGRISSPVADLLLLCYCYDPGTGRYSFAIRNTTRALCAATVLGLGFMLFRLARRPRPA